MEKKLINWFSQPFSFISLWRSLPPYEMISYIFIYASIPMLAYGIQPYNNFIITKIIFTILCLYSGFFAALIWNDITDADIDKIAHPDRPLPSGRISSKKFFVIAVFFSALTFIFAYLVNFWCLIIVFISAIFVTFHNKYLKKIIRIPAYSEIFTPIQWIIVPIFGFIAVENTNFQNILLFVIFTYFIDNAHDLPEGIHDADGDKLLGIKTYTTSFGEKNSARISFIMFLLSGIFGVIIYYKTTLSLIFLIPFLCIWVYMLYYSYKLMKSDGKKKKEMGKIVGRKGFNYFLFSFDLIFLDIFIQLLLRNFY